MKYTPQGEKTWFLTGRQGESRKAPTMTLWCGFGQWAGKESTSLFMFSLGKLPEGYERPWHVINEETGLHV